MAAKVLGRFIGVCIGGSALAYYWLVGPCTTTHILATFSILMYLLDRLAALILAFE